MHNINLKGFFLVLVIEKAHFTFLDKAYLFDMIFLLF